MVRKNEEFEFSGESLSGDWKATSAHFQSRVSRRGLSWKHFSTTFKAESPAGDSA